MLIASGVVVFALFPTLLFQYLVTAASFCSPSNSVCLKTAQTSDSSSLQFTMTSRINGWVAIGIGSSMSDAEVFLGYRTSGGNSVVLTQRKSSGHFRPDLVSTETINRTLLVINSDGTTMYQWARPLSPPTGPSIRNAVMPMIWAVNTNAGNDISGEPAIGKHTSYGTFSINLQQADSTADTSTVYAHGIMMLLAWIVLVPIGVFVARFLKHKMGVWWFRAHAGLMCLVLAVVLVSFIMILTIGTPNDLHGYLGVIIFSLMCLQIILGGVINRLFNPARITAPWWDKLHWAVGYVLLLVAFVNVPIGAYKYGDNTLANATYVIIAFFLVIFIVAQVRIGQKHHSPGNRLST